MTFGNGVIGTYRVTTDYHVSALSISNGSNLVNRTLDWTGEELNSITDIVNAANNESFTYTHDHRLASAAGPYGSLAWTYDANGNRATQTVGSATQTFVISPTSNKVTSITQPSQPTRSFTYSASGDRLTDATGSASVSQTYDYHDRVTVFKNGSLQEGNYTYDAFSRLANRSVLNLGPSTFTHNLYDQQGHVVVETNAAGASLREYIWLDDMPVAIIDNVNTTPVLYYVHADHLDRPIMVTNASGAPVWTAQWKPFGEPYSITGTLTYNARFPGQWFQFENGLNWNWHGHYDPTTGSYLQADPLGLAAMLTDGPSVYGYAGQNPLYWIDFSGLERKPGKTPPSRWPELPANLAGKNAKWNPEGYWECPGGRHITWEDRSHGAGIDRGKGPQGGHWDDENSDNRWDENGNPLPGSPDAKFEETPPTPGRTRTPSIPPWLWILPFIPFPGNPLYGGV